MDFKDRIALGPTGWIGNYYYLTNNTDLIINFAPYKKDPAQISLKIFQSKLFF